MIDFLVFTLAAAMGSFGRRSGQEVRRTEEWPGHSAVMGLIGAALGGGSLAHWQLAVGVFEGGRRERDYHTVQSAFSSVGVGETRSALLRKATETGRTATKVTYRDYLTDCCYTVGVWGGDPGPLQRALERPARSVHLGRKCCPLAAPMAPRIVAARNPVDALRDAQLPPWLDAQHPSYVVTDPFPGLHGDLVEQWDTVDSRRHWHFRVRQAVVVKRGWFART